MTRVAWTTRGGDEVEAVVAMLVNREHPRSVRISPSRGDGGVDILDPAAGAGGTDDVFQVKRFTAKLTAGQKNKVAKSLDRLTSDERWSSLRLGTWRLVTPWDPTPEAYQWLTGLAEQHGVAAVWHGLTYVDQLAAKYPDVVDYYLYGGANRIEQAYKTLMAVDRLTVGTDGLSVTDLVARIERALPALDTDPLYRYALRTGYGEPETGSDRPGLVFTSITGGGPDGRWTAVDVIARCAASTAVRPIKITGKFTVAADDPFTETLRDFFDFGVPFTSPEGAFEGDLDAPGGLGGRLEGGVVSTFTIPGDLGDNPELLLEAVDPQGTAVASVDIKRVERSGGEAGRRAVFEEAYGAFIIEDRFGFDGGGSRTIRLGEFAGMPATAAHRALEFLTSCTPPNTGRLSVRHTPPELGVVDPNLDFTWPDDVTAFLTALLGLTADLVTIQAATTTVVRVPVLGDITQGQFETWEFTARVLRGEEMTRTYPEGKQLWIQLDRNLPNSEVDGSWAVVVPLATRVGDQTLHLGSVGIVLDGPVVTERVPRGDKVMHAVTTPDRTFRYVRHLAG